MLEFEWICWGNKLRLRYGLIPLVGLIYPDIKFVWEFIEFVEELFIVGVCEFILRGGGVNDANLVFWLLLCCADKFELEFAEITLCFYLVDALTFYVESFVIF